MAKFDNQLTMPEMEVVKFDADASDEELIETIETWTNESETYHDHLLIQQDKSLAYYKGSQTDRNHIPGFNSNTVHNRIFEATETIVPIITGSAHQFIALPGTDDEQSLRSAQKVQSVLSFKYDDLDVQGHLEDVSRDMILKRFGVLEWYWNHDADDVGIRVIDPRAILIPKMQVKPCELPYVIKVLEFNLTELKENFPDLDITKVQGGGKTVDIGKKEDKRGMFQVFEVWTDEYVAWRLGTEIIERKANPYWDFKGEKDEKKLQFFNHLNRPSKPFVFFAPFRTGEGPISETSLTEIAIPVQDDINVQKRQIINNLIRMGNGQVYIDKGALEDEMLDQITSEPGLQIVGDSVASENRVRREAGTPLPNAHFSNLVDSNQTFDAIFGVQAALRGASEGGTLGGQILNQQQNLSRIDLLTRELNRGVGELANGLIQLMKMFYDKDSLLRFVGSSDAVEFIKFSREDIEDDVKVHVKSGNIFPDDPVQRSNRAIQLFQLGALAPVDLYKAMGFPNPEETQAKLQQWLSGQLAEQTQANIVEAEAGAQAKAAATPDRGVETSQSPIQRSTESITGGPSKLPGKPK